MAEAQNNKVILHRKEWQTMMPAPVTTAAGMLVIGDNSALARYSLYITSATVHYLYDHENDDWIQITSGAFGTAIGAGACGCYADWSSTYTANGGSATTITVNIATHNINGIVVGKTVEMLSGTAANLGLRRTIIGITYPGPTGNIVLTLDSALGGSVANNDTFRISSGTFFVLMPGTLSATSFRKYDMATGAWASCTNTGLPASWGTDAAMVTPGIVGTSYDTGTATSGADTKINDTTKAWTVDQWIGYQVRITGGTGVGQKRVITDSDATSVTCASFDPAPDATSTYAIEGDENAIYLMGNNATATYKYSISANSWATVGSRAGAAIAGMSADFVGVTGSTQWADITNIKDGRYIYSFRGGTAVLDRYDIPSNTWSVITYRPASVTFASGAGTAWLKDKIYIAKEGSATVPQRIYAYDVVGNTMNPVTTDWYLGGAALLGDKIWIRKLSSAGLVNWLYVLQSTSTTLRRIMLF